MREQELNDLAARLRALSPSERKRLEKALAEPLTPDHNGDVAVYELVDPETNETRYVGRSTDPHKRLHRSRQSYGWAVVQWMTQLKARGHPWPELRILAWVAAAEAASEERSWREYYGDDLLNEKTVFEPAEPWTVEQVMAERERVWAERAAGDLEAERKERLRQEAADRDLRQALIDNATVRLAKEAAEEARALSQVLADPA